MNGRGADGDSTPRRDPHPELSAPIVDLRLEARISRAEQVVKVRDARVRLGAHRIGQFVESERSQFIRRAGIMVAIGLAAGAGYAGYKALRKQAPSERAEKRRGSSPQTPKGSVRAELTALAQTALQWGITLHREQGFVGSIFGALRRALWPARSSHSEGASDQMAKGIPILRVAAKAAT